MASALALLKKSPPLGLEVGSLDLPWPGRPRRATAPALAPAPRPWPLPPTRALVLAAALQCGLTYWALSDR